MKALKTHVSADFIITIPSVLHGFCVNSGRAQWYKQEASFFTWFSTTIVYGHLGLGGCRTTKLHRTEPNQSIPSKGAATSHAALVEHGRERGASCIAAAFRDCSPSTPEYARVRPSKPEHARVRPSKPEYPRVRPSTPSIGGCRSLEGSTLLAFSLKLWLFLLFSPLLVRASPLPPPFCPFPLFLSFLMLLTSSDLPSCLQVRW